MKTRAGLRLVSLMFLGLQITAFAEVIEYRWETVNGRSYLMQYRLGQDGKLRVLPMARQSNGTYMEPAKTPDFVKDKQIGEGKVVTLNGKQYSVRFSDAGTGVGAEAYAEWQGNEWKYYEGKAPGEVATTATSTNSPPRKPITPTEENIVADFKMNERVLNLFKITGHETGPFQDPETKNWIYPNITTTTRPKIGDAKNAWRIDVDVDVDGGTFSKGGKTVLGKYTEAQVQTHIDGDFTREMAVTLDSVTPGRMVEDNLDIDYNVSASTEFRKPKRARKAIGRAIGTATAQAEAKIPQSKQKIREEVFSGTNKAAAKASASIQEAISEMSDLTSKTQPLPFSTQLSSKSGPGDSAGLRVTLHSATAKPTGERPKMDQSQQAASQFYVHQDAVNEAIAPLLAGKKMNLKETMDTICSHKLTKRLSFCNEKMDEKTAKTTILFDREDPFRITFDNDQIKLKLNAVHQVEAGPKASDNPVMKGNPYSIEVTYSIGKDRLERVGLTVTDRTPSPEPQLAEAEKKETPKEEAHTEAGASIFGFLGQAGSAIKKTFDQGVEATGRAARAYIIDPAERETLRAAYSKAFKEQVVFEPISVPTGYHTEQPKVDGTAAMVDAASLIPLDSKSANGWFSTSNFVCTKEMAAIGIDYRATAQGDAYWLTRIIPNSPADMAGLKKGEWIRAFRAIDHDADIPVAKDDTFFQDTIKQISQQPTALKRQIVLEVIDEKAKVRQVTLSLCPKGRDHLAEAKKSMASASKK